MRQQQVFILAVWCIRHNLVVVGSSPSRAPFFRAIYFTLVLQELLFCAYISHELVFCVYISQ